MSVGRPRWTSPPTSSPTCSIVCWTWDARAMSASPDPDRVGGSATAPMIRAPRWPEHHEHDDIGRILGPVQHAAAAFIELLAARTAAEPAIALGGALGSLRHGFRPAFQAPHPRPPLCEKRPYT